MHVLLMTSYFPSTDDPARASFCLEHARALARAGHQVGIAVLPWPEPGRAWGRLGFTLRGAFRWRLDEEPVSGIPGVRSLSTWPARWPRTGILAAHIHGRRVFRRYMRAFGLPDVLHAHYALCAGDVAATLKRAYGAPVVLTEHSSAFLRHDIAPGQLSAVKRALRGADHVLAVGTALADALRPFAPGRPIEVLGNPVDTAFFTLPSAPPSLSPFAVALVARLLPSKSIDLLVDAFDRAFHGSDAVLRIGGDGKERGPLEALVERRGLGAQVDLLGALSRDGVRALLHRSHVLVSCSPVETFGVTLIEAMACGLPVVATRSGGPEDIVDAGSGTLVPAQDPESLAAALRTLRAEHARYDSAAIRARCIARFGEDAIVRRLEAIYAGLLTVVPLRSAT